MKMTYCYSESINCGLFQFAGFRSRTNLVAIEGGCWFFPQVCNHTTSGEVRTDTECSLMEDDLLHMYAESSNCGLTSWGL